MDRNIHTYTYTQLAIATFQSGYKTLTYKPRQQCQINLTNWVFVRIQFLNFQKLSIQ